MYQGTFRLASDVVQVVIDKNNLMFFDVGTGMITTIDGLKFDKSGVIREFPDLENDEDWRKKASDRLKEKIKTMNTELETLNYVKEELTKFGWEAMYKMRAGFRPEKF